ncbi:UNVERIFIED_CONTAM: hypothetical protein Sradi_1965800 [Sesamum radiatum]|uniref:Uncharacterized protein n=1 Tax=Sesamum radiatum TaxID=300843 RepID=A0AAW2TEN4_SESRA
MENSNGNPSYCEKMDGLARWLGTNVAAAFFASLERCACVNVDADGEEDSEEAHDRPLMLTSLSFSSATSSVADNHIVQVNHPPRPFKISPFDRLSVVVISCQYRIPFPNSNQAIQVAF